MKKRQAKLSTFLSPEGVKAESSFSKKDSFSNAWNDSRAQQQDYTGNKKRVLPYSIEKKTSFSSGPSSMASSFRPLGGSKSFPATDYPIKAKATKPADDDVTLSVSQKKVLDAIMQRKSVFFTGAAGTGKSYILKVLRDVLEGVGFADKISFTAPTGVAACNIRGLTIHAWAGVGTAAEPVEQLSAQVARSRVAAQRWKETEILVIDEISMVSAELFDKLSFIGSRVRGDPRPFGGLQLILCGDFFQLPPIGVGSRTHFCFESKNWNTIFCNREDGMFLLDKVFRQQNDTLFLNILNDLRQGLVTPQAQRILGGKVQQSYLRDREIAAATTSTASSKQDGSTDAADAKVKTVAVRPTKLFSTNRDVDSFNASEMTKLAQADQEGEVFRYEAIDEGTEPFLNQLRQGTKAPALLELRVGAQVMLLKNISTARGLVNGARGTVVGFEKSLNRTANTAMIPLVKFQIYLGSKMTEETVSLDQETWDIRQGEKILASRVQIPLMLAWAISIHKSQGMTIPLLEVSFNGIFEYGQGYVALSRATCLEGLTLRSFQVSSIKAHTKVAEFYNQIASAAPVPTSSTGEGPPQAQEVISTKVSLFAQSFLKEAPYEDTSDQWLESRNRAATLKAAVSTYKHTVLSGDVDPLMYGKVHVLDDDDEEGNNEQEQEEEEDIPGGPTEEEEELAYIGQHGSSVGAHSGATQSMRAASTSAQANPSNYSSASNAPTSSSAGSASTRTAGNKQTDNKFASFTCDKNEWLDGDTTAEQRSRARAAYAKVEQKASAPKIAGALSTQVPIQSSPVQAQRASQHGVVNDFKPPPETKTATQPYVRSAFAPPPTRTPAPAPVAPKITPASSSQLHGPHSHNPNNNAVDRQAQESFTQWTDVPAASSTSDPFSSPGYTAPTNNNSTNHTSSVASDAANGGSGGKIPYVHGPFSPNKKKASPAGPVGPAHAYVPPASQYFPPQDEVVDLYDTSDSPTPSKHAQTPATSVSHAAPVVSTADRWPQTDAHSMWSQPTQVCAPSQGQPPAYTYPAHSRGVPSMYSQPTQMCAASQGPPQANSHPATASTGYSNSYAYNSTPNAAASASRPAPSQPSAAAPSLMQMLAPRAPVSISYAFGAPPGAQSTYATSTANTSNPSTSNTSTSNTGTAPAPLSEDVRRRVEQNRLAALERLKESRRRNEEEKNKAMQEYQV